MSWDNDSSLKPTEKSPAQAFIEQSINTIMSTKKKDKKQIPSEVTSFIVDKNKEKILQEMQSLVSTFEKEFDILSEKIKKTILEDVGIKISYELINCKKDLSNKIGLIYCKGLISDINTEDKNVIISEINSVMEKSQEKPKTNLDLD